MLAIPERRSNRIKLNIKVNEVFEPLFQPARYKGAYGGRGSGKSWCFAEMLVHAVHRRTRHRSRLHPRGSAHPHAVQQERLIESKIQALGVGPLFRVLDDRIKTPGDGLIIFQGMQDHTAESIKSPGGLSHRLDRGSADALAPLARAAPAHHPRRGLGDMGQLEPTPEE